MSYQHQISLAHLAGLQQAFDDLTKLVGPVMCGAEGVTNDMFDDYIHILQRGNTHAAWIAALVSTVQTAHKIDVVQSA